jgi:hypothetical protein
MDQLNMSNRFKQFLPQQGAQQRPMNPAQQNQVSQPPNAPMQAQARPQHPMGQMLAQGNPALQNKDSAIPILQPSAQSVSPMGAMPQGAPMGAPQAPQGAPMGAPQLPQAPEGQAANPHQAFIQTALQQGLPQEMIMQFLSSKLNMR